VTTPLTPLDHPMHYAPDPAFAGEVYHPISMYRVRRSTQSAAGNPQHAARRIAARKSFG
jgi:hypothetical protein